MRIPSPHLPTIAAALLALAAASSSQAPGDPVERALLSPPRDGLLVLGTVPGGQGAGAGIERGDILLAYGETSTTTLEALQQAIAGAADQESVTCTLLDRAGEESSVTLQPGPIGVTLRPIRKDQPAAPLPSDTGVEFDLADLDSTPREVWLAFSLDGVRRVGFEHYTLRLVDEVLHQHHEVAFDGGQQWGLNHQLVTLEVAVSTSSLRPRSTRYENALNGWLGETTLADDQERGPVLRVRWTPVEKDAEPREQVVPVPTDLPLVPSYLAPVLASYMPRRTGACFRYRPLHEGMAQLGLPAALVVAGPETVTVAGQECESWKVEQRQLGGQILTTSWVGAPGQTWRIDYGGAQAWQATRDEALADLPDGLTPRLGK